MEEAHLVSKARHEGGLFYLPPRTLLRVTGNDRLRYLNGQVTNDLRKLVPGEAMQACVLTPKGKLVALVSTSMDGDALLVETDETLAEELLARLERYIVADDVALELTVALSDRIHVFGALLHHPEIQVAPGIMIQRLGVPGKDLDAALLPSLGPLVNRKLLSLETLEILRIERGVPRWGFELTSNTLPPEALLEEASINYEKGCYLGQEIISRLRSVGQVNRLLTCFVGEEEACLVQGMELFSSDDTSRCLGSLTSVAIQPDSGHWIALGYLRRGSNNTGSSFLAVDPVSGATAKVIVTDFK